jgi:tyrosyl-tRNA synthetase
MQGFDAVSLKADIQVGGTDQLFNIIVAGRKLQETLGQEPLVGIICGILPGTDGVERMSKSTGNVIPINTNSDDMYGKVMSIPDIAMSLYFRLVSRWSPDEIISLEKELQAGKIHPRDAKMKLAHEITSIFYGDNEAGNAEKKFVQLFQKGSQPAEMPEYGLGSEKNVLDILLETGVIKSKSEGRRLIDQKGIRLNGVCIEKPDQPITQEGVLQVGKRTFLRLKK